MKIPPAHRLWIGIMIFALMLAAVVAPMLYLLNRQAGRQLTQIDAKSAAIQQAMRQLDDDVSLAASLQDAKDRAALEDILKPVDRLRVAAALEHEADEARLSHFSYSLSPEQKTNLDSPSGPQSLCLTGISLAADAPMDTQVYGYLEKLRAILPGRLRLTQLTIERDDKDNTTLTTANLHFTASLEWLSNGTGKMLAGEP